MSISFTPLFRAVGNNAILAFFFLDADSRIASEFPLNLHGALPCHRPGVIPRNIPTKDTSSRSGARQATPRRFHSGTEPFGSTPWRRCDGWIQDPIRCLMGARQHPRYSPYALLITILCYTPVLVLLGRASACRAIPGGWQHGELAQECGGARRVTRQLRRVTPRRNTPHNEGRPREQGHQPSTALGRLDSAVAWALRPGLRPRETILKWT